MNLRHCTRDFGLSLLLVLIVALLAGCCSYGDTQRIPFAGLTEFKAGLGQVYFYRPSAFVLELAAPTLTIDENAATSIKSGSYLVYDLMPGMHTFKLGRNDDWDAGDMTFRVRVQEDQRSYIRLSIETSRAQYGQMYSGNIIVSMQRVFEDSALTELSELLYAGRWP